MLRRGFKSRGVETPRGSIPPPLRSCIFNFGIVTFFSSILATTRLRALAELSAAEFRDSVVVSISACHADDPGSIPGRGVLLVLFLKFLLALSPFT